MNSQATALRRSDLKAGRLGDLVASLIDLLTDAAHAIDTDTSSAKAAIAHVSQLLQNQIVPRAAVNLHSRQTASLVEWQVRRVTKYVDGRLHRQIRIEELGQIAGLSASYFSRAFRATFGESPRAYVARCRVRYAGDLMLTTPMSFSEIALASGFSDQAHLCRNFRDLTGTTPAAWRRERRDITQGPGTATAALPSPQNRMDQHGQH